MLKIIQARLQQYMNWEFPHVQSGFREGRGNRDQIANIHYIIEKAREFQKKYLLHRGIDYTKDFVWITTLQSSSVSQLCLTPCDPMDCSMPGSSVLFYLPECAETHVHWVGDAIQPSHPLSSPSSPAFSLSQHQGLYQWVGSSHQVAKVLELQLQHQSFQWIFRVDFL